MHIKTLGANVLEARLQAELTQHEAAKLAGISQVWLCRIECGHVLPSILTLLLIAKGLDTTAAELLQGVE